MSSRMSMSGHSTDPPMSSEPDALIVSSASIERPTYGPTKMISKISMLASGMGILASSNVAF